MRPFSIERLSMMSTAQLKRVGEPRVVRPQPPCTHVPLGDLSAAQQYALVKWSRHPLCRSVALALKSSTIRDTQDDRKSLRRHGLATFDEKAFHILTEEGNGYALAAAKQIAKEIGLHITWTSGGYYHGTGHCTCGWRSHVDSLHHDRAYAIETAILKHLSSVTRGK